MGLNLTFLRSDWMSHTDDVINQGFKEASQIHKKSWIWKTDENFWFLTLTLAIWVQYPARVRISFSNFLSDLFYLMCVRISELSSNRRFRRDKAQNVNFLSLANNYWVWIELFNWSSVQKPGKITKNPGSEKRMKIVDFWL